MTTLAANKPRIFYLESPENELPIAASTIIYMGSAVGDNGSGYMRALQAGDPFRGFCDGISDNRTGAAGLFNVPLIRKGKVQLSVSGAAITDIGKPVYASDDDTYTLTEGSNSYIGRIDRFVSSGIVVVAFDATRGTFGKEVELTIAAGTPSASTTVDCGASYSQATMNNNIATLAAGLNHLFRMLSK